MGNSSQSVARVYAAALAEIGRETRTLGVIGDDLRLVIAAIEPDAYSRNFLGSPRIDREMKWEALRKAFEGNVSRPVLGLLRVLVEKGRETVFDNIVDEFEKLKDSAENRLHASVTVATPLPQDAKAALQARLERACAKRVVIDERVDPRVLGGASIRVGDRVIDRTVRARLAALRKDLMTPRETTRNTKP